MGINLIPHLIKGRITEINETFVKIEFFGRMGILQVPLRMVVNDKPIKINDEVELYMSYIQIIETNKITEKNI
jgi:hypothetical protein